jgi:hypothetical protein
MELPFPDMRDTCSHASMNSLRGGGREREREGAVGWWLHQREALTLGKTLAT